MPRSDVPAVTHVDYSARIQTVTRGRNPRLPRHPRARSTTLTGCGVIVNTCFNVRGEPIVCTPEDAYRCFMRTEMDHLVLGHFLLDKRAAAEVEEKGDWRQEFRAETRAKEDNVMRKARYIGSFLGEIVQFARQNKVYWIVPLVLILGLVILLVVTSQATAPFIYTLF